MAMTVRKGMSIFTLLRAILFVGLAWCINVVLHSSVLIFVHVASNIENGNIPNEISIASETKREQITIEPLPKIKIPKKDELVQFYSNIKSKINDKKTVSSHISESVDTIQKLHLQYENLQLDLTNHEQELQSQYDELRKSIDRALNKNLNITDDSDDVDLNIHNLQKVLSITSFAPYSSDDLNYIYDQAFDEIQRWLEMKSKNFLQKISFLRKSIDEFTCSSSESLSTSNPSLTQPPPEPKTSTEEWKNIATSSHLLSRGRDIENALLERTRQYLDKSSITSSYASPLTSEGTIAIHIFLEAKIKEIFRQFQKLEFKKEKVENKRRKELARLEQLKHEHKDINGNSEMACVDTVEDIEIITTKILNDEMLKETDLHDKEIQERSNSPGATNLWYLIQSPLFYHGIDSLNSLVDVLSGHIELLDQLIDLVMDISATFAASGKNNDEYNDYDYDRWEKDFDANALGTNLKDILHRKLYKLNVDFPKDLEPYWKKTGLLKGDCLNTLGNVVRSIPDDPVNTAQIWGQELKEWFENTIESFS